MSTPRTKMIPLADITVPENRMRQLRPEKVDRIIDVPVAGQQGLVGSRTGSTVTVGDHPLGDQYRGG
jgi:hypothetical protein